MKRYLMYVCICFIWVAPLNAQLIKSYGVKAGYSSSFLDWKYRGRADVADRRNGIIVGAYTEWLDLPYLSFITQIEYGQRGRSRQVYVGGRTSGPIHGWTMTSDRVDYFSIPMLLKLSLPLGSISPFITMGPRLDIIGGHESTLDDRLYDGIRASNYGGAFSIGGEVKNFLPATLSLEGRYNFDYEALYSTRDLTIRGNSFDLLLGIGL